LADVLYIPPPAKPKSALRVALETNGPRNVRGRQMVTPDTEEVTGSLRPPRSPSFSREDRIPRGLHPKTPLDPRYRGQRLSALLGLLAEHGRLSVSQVGVEAEAMSGRIFVTDQASRLPTACENLAGRGMGARGSCP